MKPLKHLLSGILCRTRLNIDDGVAKTSISGVGRVFLFIRHTHMYGLTLKNIQLLGVCAYLEIIFFA